VQKPLTSGSQGWPAGQTPWLTDPTLHPLTGCLLGDALHEAVIRNLRLTVGGGRVPWSARHVSMLTGQHLAYYQLNQVGNSSWDSYKYPPTDGIQYTCQILEIPLAKLPFLVW
jgi:hypothetical protein